MTEPVTVTLAVTTVVIGVAAMKRRVANAAVVMKRRRAGVAPSPKRSPRNAVVVRLVFGVGLDYKHLKHPPKIEG